jgi:hypothetical protein
VADVRIEFAYIIYTRTAGSEEIYVDQAMFLRSFAPVRPEYAEMIEMKFDTLSLNKALLGYLIFGFCRPVQFLLHSKLHCNFVDPKSIVVMVIVCTAC